MSLALKSGLLKWMPARASRRETSLLWILRNGEGGRDGGTGRGREGWRDRFKVVHDIKLAY